MRRPLMTIHPYLKRNGVAGFVEYLDTSDHRLLTNCLLAFDRKFIGLGQFARDWVVFESLVKHTSVPDVARKYNDYMGMDLFINRLPKQFSEESHPAILMGINHESIIEPVFLVSLLARTDIKFLGMKVFQYLGPNIKDLILPVLPSRIATDYSGSLKTRVATWIKPIYQVYKLDECPTREIKAINQQSIDKAVEHITSGGILELYPTGGRSIEKNWYPGIGRILNSLATDILTQTPIFPVITTGLTRNIVYRSMRRVALRQPKRHAVYLNIFDQINIPTHLAGTGAEKILTYLKDETTIRLNAFKTNSSLVEMIKFPFENQANFTKDETQIEAIHRLASHP